MEEENMKKLLSIILSCALIVSLCLFTGCFSGGQQAGGSDGKKDDTPVVAETACVNIDINPSIELVVDKDGKVVAVRGANDDGVLLIYGETGIKGETLENAVTKITETAIQLGYLDETNKVVSTIVNAADKDFIASLTEKVNSSVTVTAQNSGLTVTTDSEGSFSLLRQMEELKKAYPQNKAIQSVTVSKFRLALSASETGNITLEAAIALDDSVLLNMIEKADKLVEEYATAEFLTLKARLQAVYDKAVTVKTYAAYSNFYTENILKHPTTAYYGAAYQLYATAETGFRAVTSSYGIKQQIKNYELNEEQLTALVAAFGFENADEFKDENGKVTIKSIESFADKFFKNTALEGEAEKLKAAVMQAVAEVEEVVKAEIDKISESYKTQIQDMLTQAESIYANVEPVLLNVKSVLETLSFMPGIAEALTDIDSLMMDYKTINNGVKEYLKGSNLSVTELEKFAMQYGEKAEMYYEKIQNDLTAADKTTIETAITAIVNESMTEKNEFENSLNELAQSVKTALQAAKENLKNN